MKQWRAVLSIAWILFSPFTTATETTAPWQLQADYVDACSCDLTCPCLFGGSPTHGFCKGATLLEIQVGHYGAVDLAGVTVLAVYNGGKWIKYFVSENATEEQTETVVKLLPIAEGFFDAPVREVSNVPITVSRTESRVMIRADKTLIELEQIRNANGEPIKVQGLPAHGFPGLPYIDHTQYKSIALSHDSEKENFSFSETNGYTARIDASSDEDHSSHEPGVAARDNILMIGGSGDASALSQ